MKIIFLKDVIKIIVVVRPKKCFAKWYNIKNIFCTKREEFEKDDKILLNIFNYSFKICAKKLTAAFFQVKRF
jgi:hypothetical protein